LESKNIGLAYLVGLFAIWICLLCCY